MSNAPPPEPRDSARDPLAQDPGPKRPWYKRAAFLVVLLFAGIVLVVWLAGIGGDDEQKEDEAENAKDPGTSQSIETPGATESPASDEESWTESQKEAVQAAEDYVAVTAVSRTGLIRHLVTLKGGTVSEADATFAADHVDADWNAEAVEAAEGYMEQGGFDRQSLIRQLTAPSGDAFTQAQAEYAADKVGV
ncbi:Ltp family lipoprotein [Mumia quercus]|uniref:Ltp family lipoprotein n=1 Tax=Mumia quercus TaxID=2976125 RepID=UPI0021D08D3A|nr:Ltp family lipoprotein [Mumia quercus]